MSIITKAELIYLLYSQNLNLLRICFLLEG